MAGIIKTIKKIFMIRRKIRGHGVVGADGARPAGSGTTGLAADGLAGEPRDSERRCRADLVPAKVFLERLDEQALGQPHVPSGVGSGQILEQPARIGVHL